jgi:Zn-dependent protease
MFGRGIRLFKLLGFEVRVDLSWVILAVLITWSLAKGVFPEYYHGFSTGTYWWMGALGALGLFISIILHELSHSLVARSYGIPMKGITLFIFGGVAEMTDEPKTAKSELLMAVAGPISSVVIGIICYIIYRVTRGAWSRPIEGVLVYLAFINVVLAGFNMIPAYPLDGGRVLRAALWSWKKDIRWATRLSSRIGSGFGIVLIILGAFDFITGNFIGGIWLFLIGLFLRSVSQGSYQQLLMRRALEGESVRRFMKTDPITVSSSLTVEKLVEDYIYQYHYKFYPVVDGGRLTGCITVAHVKDVPREEWSSRQIGDLIDSCSTDNSIDINADAVTALSAMRRTGNSRLMVVENGELKGIIALKDMLEFLSLKIDLEK